MEEKHRANNGLHIRKKVKKKKKRVLDRGDAGESAVPRIGSGKR